VTEVEREGTIRALRESYARGDLTNEEFDDKLNALFAARTSAEIRELRPVVDDAADAPAPPGSADPADFETVERHVSSGEQIEWVGKPDPTKRFARGDSFLIPFSIMWGGFALFWEAAAISSGSAFAVLWGVPFVLIGLYMIFGRFIYKSSRKRRTTYAVTDRRVMTIVRGRRGESVEATYLRSIPNISTSAVAGGRGSVDFGLSLPMAGWYGNSGMEFLGRGQMGSAGVSFLDIEDPRGVADLVERLREADRRG
jgi:uncharacterized membrane protein